MQRRDRRVERRRTPDQTFRARLGGRAAYRGEPLDVSHYLLLRIEYRPQFDIDMLRPARCVMNVEHAVGAAQLKGPLHWTVLARLVARYVVVMRDLIALAAHMRLAGDAELTLISGIGSEDAVLGIEHDHGLSVVLQIRHEGVDIQRLRRPGRGLYEGRDGYGRLRGFHGGGSSRPHYTSTLPRLPSLPPDCQKWQPSTPDGRSKGCDATRWKRNVNTNQRVT